MSHSEQRHRELWKYFTSVPEVKASGACCQPGNHESIELFGERKILTEGRWRHFRQYIGILEAVCSKTLSEKETASLRAGVYSCCCRPHIDDSAGGQEFCGPWRRQ